MIHDISYSVDSDVERWAEELGSNDPILRQQAREHLVAVGHDTVLPLLRRLKEPNGPACWEAAKALAEIKDPASANALAEALEHDNQSVRWLAAKALTALGSEGLKQTLVELLTKAHSTVFRQSARHVISHFSHRLPWEYLMPLLKNFDGYEPAVAVPLAALKALHSMHNRQLARNAAIEKPESGAVDDVLDW